jgi:uncharacterized protein (TIGR02996 family)
MTRESLDLLAAVLDSPSDDAPRLVYADWLDEHGQADRAEFIRLQCELARSDHEHAQLGRSYILMDRRWLAGRRAPAAGCPCRWCELRRRAQALLRESDWFSVDGLCVVTRLNPLDPHSVDAAEPVGAPERGFLHTLRVEATDWLEHGDALTWDSASGSPCPPTAQPLAEVQLVSRPLVGGSLKGFYLSTDDRSDHFLHKPAKFHPGDDPTPDLLPELLQARWPSVGAWRVPPLFQTT